MKILFLVLLVMATGYGVKITPLYMPPGWDYGKLTSRDQIHCQFVFRAQLHFGNKMSYWIPTMHKMYGGEDECIDWKEEKKLWKDIGMVWYGVGGDWKDTRTQKLLNGQLGDLISKYWNSLLSWFWCFYLNFHFRATKKVTLVSNIIAPRTQKTQRLITYKYICLQKTLSHCNFLFCKRKQTLVPTLVHWRFLLKYINELALVIGTSGFGAILNQILGCLGLFQGWRGPKMQK